VGALGIHWCCSMIRSRGYRFPSGYVSGGVRVSISKAEKEGEKESVGDVCWYS
jgi:hypothetical protein